jgi:cell division septation protein DedD
METQAIDVPGKGTLIRVLVGPFAARPEAEKLCADLKARKQDCLVR